MDNKILNYLMGSFQNYWDPIVEVFLKFFEDYLMNGKSSMSRNSFFITLVPEMTYLGEGLQANQFGDKCI